MNTIENTPIMDHDMIENAGNKRTPFGRNALDFLQLWLRQDPGDRRPIILRGARQVGKSTLVHQLAKIEHLNLIELNLERNPKFQKVFESGEFDATFEAIEHITNQDLGLQNSILFIDEIQKSPKALEALRYFHEDHPNQKVIAAGSLLDFTLADSKVSMPVGRIQYAYLQPFSFTEFLSAMGKGKLANSIRTFSMGKRISDAVHEEISKYFRHYLFVGGMPEAIRIWAKTKKPDRVTEVHQSILSTYRDDFSKYATKKELQRLQKLFDQIPASIGTKVKYSNFSIDDQARKIRSGIELLSKAKVVSKVHHSNCSGIPIAAQKDEFAYKLYFLDVGLVSSALDLKLNNIMVKEPLLIDGSLAEQAVFQNLKASRCDQDFALHYWIREGKSDNAEVDFVISIEGKIIPIEVKSGKSGSLRSLQQFMAEKKGQYALRFDANIPSLQTVEHSVVTTKGTTQVRFELVSLPCYMAEESPRILGQILRS